MANQKATDHVCQKAREAFEAMDKDDSGAVSMSEFREYCSRVPGMENCSEAFCDIDTSDDFKITLDELNVIVAEKVPKDKIAECHVKDLFKSIDTSGDGKLDKNEFKQLLCGCDYPEDTINQMMAEIGGDDGKISLSEFLVEWKKQQ